MKSLSVEYIGQWEDYIDGHAIAVRRHALALARTGLVDHVLLRSKTFTHRNFGVTARYDYQDLPPEVINEVGPLTTPRSDHYDFRVVHCRSLHDVAQLAVPRLGMLPPVVASEAAKVQRAMNDITIPFLHLEHGISKDCDVSMLRAFPQVWVPSIWASLELSTALQNVVPIRIIPHPMAVRDPVRLVDEPLQPQPLCFLNIGTWEPRKAQDLLIWAFMRAVKPSGEVQLVMKSSKFGSWWDDGRQHGPLGWIEQLIQQDDKVKEKGWKISDVSMWQRGTQMGEAPIVLIGDRMLTRDEILVLYELSHYYVSCGRAEAYDLCAFDAKMAGRRLLIPTSGVACRGPYTDAEDGKLGAIKGEPDKRYKLSPGATWHELDLHHIELALSQACVTYRPLERKAHRPEHKPFRIDAVGDKMARCLMELHNENGGDCKH